MKRLARRAVVTLVAHARPGTVYPLYGRWLRKQQSRFGFERGVFCLTFDNDYPEDHEGTAYMLPALAAAGIRATWAVIGKWIAPHRELYKAVLDGGHELMNHSWSHPDNPLLRPGDPRKFQHVDNAEVELEIERAHDESRAQLGYEMRGFRLPHFSPHPAVARTLRRLGYRYTSNELAIRGEKFGVPHLADGLLELPLAGTPRRPDRVIETYRVFRKPDGLYVDEAQLLSDVRELLAMTERHRLFTCVYMDPCDVMNLSRPAFEAYLATIMRFDVDCLTLGEAARRIRPSLEQA